MSGGRSGEETPPEGIDWAEIHRRMEAVRTAINRGPGTGEKKDILKMRARALAKEPDAPQPGQRSDVLEFLLAHERYGIEFSYVREVWPLKDLTAVPCTPPFVLGVINVRGQILSVVDLKKFLDLPEKGLGDLNKVIVLESAPGSNGMEFCVLADLVLGVRSVPLEGLQRSMPTLAGAGEEFFKGVTREGLILLDAGRVLRDRRMVVNDEVF